MKKNKMMRAALAFLVVTMLTMSIVSGTFAKYVTSGSASDSARVAKFGVEVSASGNLYSTTYAKGDNTSEGATLSVESSDTTNVVAPGTKSSGDGLKISVTGTPEVAVNIDFDVTATDIFLNDYYPVKYTLTKGGTALVTNGTLAAVKTALEGALVSKEYAAKSALDTTIGDLELTWEWDFDDAGEGTYDEQDTLLGDLAAGVTPNPTLASGTYSLNTSLAITVTVTQVD